jgi:hypothetical protein
VEVSTEVPAAVEATPAEEVNTEAPAAMEATPAEEVKTEAPVAMEATLEVNAEAPAVESVIVDTPVAATSSEPKRAHNDPREKRRRAKAEAEQAAAKQG